MLHGEAFGVLVGAIILGGVHGIEPGHGWPVAASYALDQTNKWLYGFAASLILGVGHLVSSLVMVGAFFYAKDYFELTQANEPITIFGDVQIGGPVSLVAGVLLIGLGIREYTHGHSHGDTAESGHAEGETESHGVRHSGHRHEQESSHSPHGHSHGSEQHDHEHQHVRDPGKPTRWSRVTAFLPFGGGHAHEHGTIDDAANRGLLGIAWFAFVLGFAHEEEFEIIALCAGSNYCLELMSAYALTVIIGIIGLTMALIAGFQHYEETVEKYTPYLPAFSAAVLGIMGLGFITGLF